jgi:hypothetical protein
MRGLGDSTPEIEAKANEMLNRVASITSNIAFGPRAGQEVKLAYAVGFNYSMPGQAMPRSWWYPQLIVDLFRDGMIDRVRGQLIATQEEFMAFLLAAGYPEGSARHMAAFTSFAFPIQPGSNLLSPRWYHTWGTSNIGDALSSSEIGTWDAMRKAVIDNLRFWSFHSQSGNVGRVAIENWDAAIAPYATYLDWVWQKLLVMLRSTPRESAADLAIKAGINGKFQQLLGRASTQQEIDAWFPQIKAGTKTLDDLDAYIRGMVEYTQKHPGGTNGKKDDKKEAGTGLDFLKSPWVWVAAAAAGGFYYWTQVKKQSMGQLPYVGKYLKGR